eukprot:5458796-Prymnesium_polylepis.1
MRPKFELGCLGSSLKRPLDRRWLERRSVRPRHTNPRGASFFWLLLCRRHRTGWWRGRNRDGGDGSAHARKRGAP